MSQGDKIFTRQDRTFTRKEINDILGSVINKTLGEIDKNNVFKKTIKHSKITGIAGDVIEESVLEYPSDNKQEADIFVDGIETEVKTTGIRIKEQKNTSNIYEAKEPMSITAVSPEKIVFEDFLSSMFWHKLEHMLLVYYLYDSKKTVPAADYANFPIKGYELYEFNEIEKGILEQDWIKVRDFIKFLHANYPEPTNEYPRISSALRSDLMMIDTAPKWPNRPRFRLKRATVSTIVQQYFGRAFEQLNDPITSFSELDARLNHFSTLYKGKSVKELLHILKIPTKLTPKKDVSKNVTERIVTSMFGAKSKKISNIELFSEIGLMSKTITITTNGYRTEDTKLEPIDFTEWKDETINFEDSSIYEYFSQNQFLFIIFEEKNSKDKLLDNKFLGFKRLSFSDEFIEQEVKRTWDDTRNLLINNNLEKTVVNYTSGIKKGHPVINKNGQTKTSINFPKSRDYAVFLRGTGRDSSDKTEIVNGIAMYKQNYWIKGHWITNKLLEIDYI
ncbi:restriction endonuclease [Marinilactibacillus sp. 15R]|uniref:MutH/Sau3AI family endonuclease n=1 Tax=Marinilactibacillus sp. 15R TaxID=1911586 RepID=UPI00090B9726|nr:MutH/Sau3AI family endonuclease [Marinilactibacillus sp. 15R]API90059.1 restriction endonuclease [Marinilactibacillus sp. 15R]